MFTFRTCIMNQPAGQATYCQSKARYSWNIFRKISPYKLPVLSSNFTTPFPAFYPVGAPCRFVHVQYCGERQRGNCPLLNPQPLLFPPPFLVPSPAHTTHVSSREFSFGVSNARSNASRLFTPCLRQKRRHGRATSLKRKC